MYVIAIHILAYAHDVLMAMLYFSKTLGRRHSMKITVLATAGLWILMCAYKLPALYLNSQDYNSNLLVVVQTFLTLTYLLAFYKSSFVKKLLAFLLMTAALGVAEFTTVLITGTIWETEGGAIEVSPSFLVAGLLLVRPLVTLGYYAAFQIWNALQRSFWIRGSRQWLCIILPLSQAFLLWYLADMYPREMELFPVSVLAGVILGFAADIYMFVIFEQAQKREQTEHEICLQKHLYELECLRYNRLKESLEEAARLRHDFQNYLLVIRSMAEEKNTEEQKEQT